MEPPEELTSNRFDYMNERPCTHNNWDNVRIKKGTATLRCRECQAQWKVCHATLPRCQPFLTEGVCPEEKCSLIHVNQFKQNLKTRRELHGDVVLANIPATFWDNNRKKKNARLKGKKGKGSDETASNGSSGSDPIRQILMSLTEDDEDDPLPPREMAYPGPAAPFRNSFFEDWMRLAGQQQS